MLFLPSLILNDHPNGFGVYAILRRGNPAKLCIILPVAGCVPLPQLSNPIPCQVPIVALRLGLQNLKPTWVLCERLLEVSVILRRTLLPVRHMKPDVAPLAQSNPVI